LQRFVLALEASADVSLRLEIQLVLSSSLGSFFSLGMVVHGTRSRDASSPDCSGQTVDGEDDARHFSNQLVDRVAFQIHREAKLYTDEGTPLAGPVSSFSRAGHRRHFFIVETLDLSPLQLLHRPCTSEPITLPLS